MLVFDVPWSCGAAAERGSQIEDYNVIVVVEFQQQSLNK